MKIIRITLKEGGDTKVILFRQEKQNASGTFLLNQERHLPETGRGS